MMKGAREGEGCEGKVKGACGSEHRACRGLKIGPVLTASGLPGEKHTEQIKKASSIGIFD
jgi:hypothetical protein